MNIFEQYQTLGIEDKMSHTTSRVEDVLKDRILNPITAKGESKVPRKEIEKLKNVLTILKKGLLVRRLFCELIVIINTLRSKVTNSEIDLQAF